MSMTRQEVFQAVMNGLEVEVRDNKHTNPKYENINNGFFHALNPSSFDKFDWRIKPEPLSEHENISKHRVLLCVDRYLTNDEISQFLGWK